MFKKSTLQPAVNLINMTNKMEECLAALTQITVNTYNERTVTFRSRIENEIRFIPNFDGAPGTLPSFKGAIDRMMLDHPNEQIEVFKIIYNIKIQGAAKNILAVAPPGDWEQCKAKLQTHYRPSKDQFQITKSIGELRVSSILELDISITKLIEEITELASYDVDMVTITTIFSSLLIQKIKELTLGTLAYTISDKYNLTEIREIVRKFIGQDEYNIKNNNVQPQYHNTHFTNNNYQHNFRRQGYNQQNNFNNAFRRNHNQNGNFFHSNTPHYNQQNQMQNSFYRNGENHNNNNQNQNNQFRSRPQHNQFFENSRNQNSGQIRNNSGQTRQSHMEVDNISQNNDPTFF